MQPVSCHRRDLLRVLGAGVLGAACGGGSPPCVAPSDAQGRSYCLVSGDVVRVPLAGRLVVGQAVLFNVDDNTAVLVVRDAGGAYAMSAICTHQCCLLALCEDAACTALGTNPGTCAPTVTAMPAATGAALICACHGSTFGIDGTVLTGPAVRDLPHYAVTFDADDALVDTSRVVPATTRAAFV